METKEFDFGNEKIDMSIAVVVRVRGVLWWKKQEIDVSVVAIMSMEEYREGCKVCDITYDKEKSYIVPKAKELIDFRISKGEEIVGGDGEYGWKRYNMNMSSFWSNAKKDEAIDYFVNSVIKWKV